MDIPIIFSGPMVRALLDGRKTMTRRLAWGKQLAVSDEALEPLGRHEHWRADGDGFYTRPSPWQRVKPGDHLWVKEDLQRFNREPRATVQYVADISGVPHRGQVEGSCDGRAYWNWKVKYLTGRYCPRWASRLTLIVTATKVERLQELSETDFFAEGGQLRWLKAANCAPRRCYSIGGNAAGEGACEQPSHSGAFELLFDNLHGPDSWDANPEVVALTFTVHKTNIDALASEAA